jgi:hypothetical protein
MTQRDLLDQLDLDLLNTENAPSLDLELDVIAIIKQCERNSGLGRDRFLDRINLCLRDTGQKVTKIQLNKWLSPSQDNCVPAWVMPSICWALNSIEPMTALLNPLGFKPADMRADMLRQKAELDINGKLRQKESREIERALQQLMMRGK